MATGTTFLFLSERSQVILPVFLNTGPATIQTSPYLLAQAPVMHSSVSQGPALKACSCGTALTTLWVNQAASWPRRSARYFCARWPRSYQFLCFLRNADENA